jgi:hypothetical protein
MGADYQGQERALAELRALSRDAKEYLNHHIGNSLNIIHAGIENFMIDGMLEMATKEVWHIVDDLYAAGIRNARR